MTQLERQDRKQDDKDSPKKNRRSYLRDFVKNADGAYVYTGKMWHADPALRRRMLVKLWALQAGMLLSVILPGFATTAGLQNTFYVIMPYMLWLISDIALTYTLGSMTFGGNPLRGLYLRTQRGPLCFSYPVTPHGGGAHSRRAACFSPAGRQWRRSGGMPDLQCSADRGICHGKAVQGG